MGDEVRDPQTAGSGGSAQAPPSQRHLLRQFLPLALSGVFFPLVPPIVNAALARTADPAAALAAMGLIRSLTVPLLSPLFSLRQVTTALARDLDMLGHVRRSSWLLSTGATAILLLLCLPPVYQAVVRDALGIPADVARTAWPALWVAAATSPLLGVARGYYQGVLVHHGRAGPIGTGALVYLIGAATAIWAAVWSTSINGALLATLALAWAQLLYLIVVGVPARRVIAGMPARVDRVEDGERSVRYVLLFTVPLAVAAVLGAAGNPLTQASMARTLQPVASLAAFPVCTSVLFLATTPLWNIQQVVIAHVEDPASYAAVRRFVLKVAAGWTLALAIVGWTPLAAWVFGDLIGVTGAIEDLSIRGFRWLVIGPLLFAGRSLYYGTLISQAATRHVRTAAVVRLAALVAVLVLGVVWQRQPGLLIAVWATLVSMAVELVVLRRYVRTCWR